MKLEYLKKYKSKIKTVKEVQKIINRKNNKIILCHGNFDVVHPGHIRHLAYAKSKADILLVSITKDKFISKGVYRPHVPENLRALITEVVRARPSSAKGKYLKKISLSSSMGPSLLIDQASYT